MVEIWDGEEEGLGRDFGLEVGEKRENGGGSSQVSGLLTLIAQLMVVLIEWVERVHCMVRVVAANARWLMLLRVLVAVEIQTVVFAG